MTSQNSSTIWPVMLTPFTDTGSVDYTALQALIEWYEQNGVHGLFAACQSSEMFFLSLRERVELAAFIKKHATVPVIASGHISYDLDDQVDELKRIANTGVDAVIMLTNRMAQQDEHASTWKNSLEYLLNGLPDNIPLGLYECPYPYKHLISDDELSFCASTGRFRFLKDTCCDISLIRHRTKILEGSTLGLYNANTSTLLQSLQCGGKGFSGVMANFHPELYVWLAKNWQEQPEKAEQVQSLLTLCSFIERQLYPVNAKYHLSQLGLPMTTYTRSKSYMELSDLFKDEVNQMADLIDRSKSDLGLDI